MMVLSGSSEESHIQNPAFRKETMPDIEKGLSRW